jgi:hypothetical protein
MSFANCTDAGTWWTSECLFGEPCPAVCKALLLTAASAGVVLVIALIAHGAQLGRAKKTRQQ